MQLRIKIMEHRNLTLRLKNAIEVFKSGVLSTNDQGIKTGDEMKVWTLLMISISTMAVTMLIKRKVKI